MANRTFDFIAETGEPSGHDAQTRRRVRSHAMRRFRRMQKLENEGDHQRSLTETPIKVLLSDNSAGNELSSGGEQSSSTIAQASHQAWRNHRGRSNSIDTNKLLQDARRWDAARMGDLSTTPTPDASQKQEFRMTLINSFIDGWVGRDAVISQSLELGLVHFESPRSAGEKNVSDALGLLQLGAQTSDLQVVQEARRKYSAAAAYTSGAVDTSAISTSRLPGTSMVHLCNMYTLVSTGVGSWDASLLQISSIIDAIPSQGSAPSSMRLFIQQFRHCSLLYSLACGRRTVNERTWQLCSSMAQLESAERVVRLGLRLPRLMEAAVASHVYTHNNTSLSEVRSRLLQTELDLVSPRRVAPL